MNEHKIREILAGSSDDMRDERVAKLLGQIVPMPDSTAREVVDALGGARGVFGASEDMLLAAGVGVADWCATIRAAVGLAREYRAFHGAARRPMDAPDQLYAIARSQCWDALEVETFFVVSLNVRNEIVGIDVVGIGSDTSVDIVPRNFFRPAIRRGAVGVIAMHNHPSGDPTPSPEDIAITSRMSRAATLLGLAMVDHVVIATDGFRSIAESHPGDLSCIEFEDPWRASSVKAKTKHAKYPRRECWFVVVHERDARPRAIGPFPRWTLARYAARVVADKTRKIETSVVEDRPRCMNVRVPSSEMLSALEAKVAP